MVGDTTFFYKTGGYGQQFSFMKPVVEYICFLGKLMVNVISFVLRTDG